MRDLNKLALTVFSVVLAVVLFVVSTNIAAKAIGLPAGTVRIVVFALVAYAASKNFKFRF